MHAYNTNKFYININIFKFNFLQCLPDVAKHSIGQHVTGVFPYLFVWVKLFRWPLHLLSVCMSVCLSNTNEKSTLDTSTEIRLYKYKRDYEVHFNCTA